MVFVCKYIKFDIKPTGYTYRVISINPEPISRGYNIFNNKAVESNIFTWLDTLNSVCNCRLNLVNNLKKYLAGLTNWCNLERTCPQTYL